MVHQVLNLLKKYSYGIRFQKLVNKLNISSKEKQVLKAKLRQLEGAGLVFRMGGKYYLHRGTELVSGKLVTVVKDYGFVKPHPEELPDIFIPPGKAGHAVLGDEVELAYVYNPKKGKPEGRIIRVKKKAKKTIIGMYENVNGQDLCFPFDSPSKEGIRFKAPSRAGLKNGGIIEVDRSQNRLKRILGMPDEPGVDVEVITQKYGLRPSFPSDVLSQAEDFKSGLSASPKKGRKDFRDWISVTIDGKDARDFDDAVSIKKQKEGGFLLGVHIADVSHYVKPGSAIDKEAYLRATSVYFPDQTFPMLPEKLSNQICSLRPQEEKLTVSVVLEINRNGEVTKKDFFRSVISTQARLTYNSVYKIFLGDRKERNRYSSLVAHLMNMRKLASILRKKRLDSGSLDFELAEPELVYQRGVLDAVVPFITNEAHWLIEEFMLAANEAVASFLSDLDIPMLYRIHPPPAKNDIVRFKEILNHFGLSLPKGSCLGPKHIQSILEQIQGWPEEKFITLEMLKSLQIAVYSTRNSGHFGLGKKDYTHFTSPIRRYPDLIIHRILKSVLRDSQLNMGSLDSDAEHCSEQERNAEEAEKDLVEWRIYRLLQSKLGEQCKGFIVEISKSGLIVELDNYFVTGMILYHDMKEDYYMKKGDKTVSGRRTGIKFSIGEKVSVMVLSVSPESRRMNLGLVKKIEKTQK
ncbi:MAG: ribonuclease R [Candidatus Aminicenantes bacterium]|nr:ribonuclease R [Candidatus Aminicenantes bacterium]